MKTLLLSLALTNLAASAIFLAPACMLTGTIFLTAGALGGREAYCDATE
jgi:hypothetical protein